MSQLVITFLVGLVLPALVAFVTKETLPQWIKSLILLFLSTVAGVISGLAASPPASWHQWQAVLVAIFVTFVSAAASDHSLWTPSGALSAISSRTRGFGIGAQPREASMPHESQVPG